MGIRASARARLFGWIHQRGVVELRCRMTNLPSRAARRAWRSISHVTTPLVVARERSADGTEKFLLRLVDGRQHRIGLHPGHAGR